MLTGKNSVTNAFEVSGQKNIYPNSALSLCRKHSFVIGYTNDVFDYC